MADGSDCQVPMDRCWTHMGLQSRMSVGGVGAIFSLSMAMLA